MSECFNRVCVGNNTNYSTNLDTRHAADQVFQGFPMSFSVHSACGDRWLGDVVDAAHNQLSERLKEALIELSGFGGDHLMHERR